MKKHPTGRAEANYLLDTCVLSELIRSAPDDNVLRWLEKREVFELYTSAMTLAELKRGVERLPSSRRQSALNEWIQQLENRFEGRVLPFDTKAAQAWAKITVHAETQGKPLAAFDSIIAATALANNCRVVTRNTRDFVHCGVGLINPWITSPTHTQQHTGDTR